MWDLQKSTLFEDAILPHIDQIIQIWDEEKKRKTPPNPQDSDEDDSCPDSGAPYRGSMLMPII